MVPTDLRTIFQDTGKPDRAVPVTTECALPGAFTSGEVTASPTPTPILEIRHPRTDDLAGILSVVRSCGPYLTEHDPYIYWMQIRQYGPLSAVAVLNAEIAGWCCTVLGASGNFFVHQLGVAPNARRHGVARA